MRPVMMRPLTLTAALLLATAPAAWAGRQAIVKGPRTLRGFGFESMAFQVPGDWMRNPRVRGRLEVTGDGGKDIDVFMLRVPDLDAWEKNQSVTPLHAAKRASAVDLDVPLPGPDRYVVVLSNRFSKLTKKQVAGDVLLTWDEDPSLPTGDALRRQVRFLDLPSTPGRQAVHVKDADSVQAVLLERGPTGLPSISVRRRHGNEPRVTQVGRYVGSVHEIGLADVHGDGDRDVLVVGAGTDSAGARRDLMLVCPRQNASLSLSLVWARGAEASPPAVRYGDDYAQARFAHEQSFLERVVGAYRSR